MSKQYTIDRLPVAKAIAHILKNAKNDCIGVLLGQNTEQGIHVTDCIPLFHDKVFASTLESAFAMISHVYANKHDIVGVYDAPLKYNTGDAVPLSPLSKQLAEQVRATLHVADCLVLSLRVNNKSNVDDDDDDTPVREITETDEPLIVQGFLVTPGSTRKVTNFKKLGSEVQLKEVLDKGLY